MSTCCPGCLFDLLVRRIHPAEADVFLDRSGKQMGVLQNHGDMAAQFFAVVLLDFDSVDQDLTFLNVIEAVQKIRDRCLAGTGGTYKSDLLTGQGFDVDILQDGLLRYISEGDMLQFYMAFDLIHGLGRIDFQLFRFLIHHIEYTLGTGQRGEDRGDLVGQVHDRERELVGIVDENGQTKTKEVLRYPHEGEDATPKLGDYIFEDVNKDGVLDEKDMVILGNGFPDLNFGLTLGATYKNFDVSLYMYGELGKKIFSYSAMRLSNMFTSDDGTAPRILQEVADNAWSTSNPNGEYSRLSFQDKALNMRASDKWVKNGNFLRFANLQIGYTLPKAIAKKIYLENARVSLSVSNLACISPYNKYGDPETGGKILVTGLDTGRYPMPRTYTLGLNVTF